MRHLALFCIFFLVSCSQAKNASAPNGQKLSIEIGETKAAPIDYQLTPLAEGLESPWCFAFLPSGDMLVTEKAGRLRLIRDHQLLPMPVLGVPEVFYAGQAGLFDVALHPDFANNHIIFLSYAAGRHEANTLRLAKARYVPTPEAARLEEVEVIFDSREPRQSTSHYGGKIAFLADKTLLLTIGEGYRYRNEAQKLDNYYGKIIRITDDGTAPPDNPFISTAEAMSEIFTYGHRNPQGLVVDADRQIIYQHEHGPKGGDEVNIIIAGKNYGWPVITYGIDYSGAIISPFHQKEGMEQSVVHYIPSIATSGLTLYQGDKFPQWQGDLFLGALAGRHVKRIDLLPDGTFGEQTSLFTELNQRIRDVRTGPDGFLYILTDRQDGAVIKVSPLGP
ncbi:MAG: PQQ-dependent sugar dehydrogenase [bacterium]